MSDNFYKQAILNQLDRCAETFNFPVLDNVHWRVADTRLTVFLDQEWAIVFEIIAFDIRIYSFVNIIYGYGSEVVDPGFKTSVEIFSASPDHPFEDDYGNTILDLHDFDLIIEGQEHNFAITNEQLAQYGLLLHDSEDIEANLLRIVCSLYQNRFFLDNEKLLLLLNRPHLQPFLRLDDWKHPNIAGGELPSKTACFQRLAEAISQKNQEIYSCSQNEINTDWKNWTIPKA
ncbi:MAG TPA: hypothetical protein P5121_37950 [Caldilineaceae bacterium]|nr:hypothetical protein [Caldilineaceae bacterium]